MAFLSWDHCAKLWTQCFFDTESFTFFFSCWKISKVTSKRPPGVTCDAFLFPSVTLLSCCLLDTGVFLFMFYDFQLVGAPNFITESQKRWARPSIFFSPISEKHIRVSFHSVHCKADFCILEISHFVRFVSREWLIYSLLTFVFLQSSFTTVLDYVKCRTDSAP